MLKECVECRSVQAIGEDGICPYKQAEDNLPLRCVGKWSKDKLYYLQKYINIFSLSMKNRWAKRAYIDLFAGPGLCVVRESGEIILGSPLVAIDQLPLFSRYIFIDISKESVESLERRVELRRPEAWRKLFNRDCNSAVDEIRGEIDNSYLVLAFVDPTSMQINFSSIEKLTQGLRMDLIINFPLQAINRSYPYAFKGHAKNYDNFFGSGEWREILQQYPDIHSVGTKLLFLYKSQLGKIGYGDIRDLDSSQYFESDEILVKGPKNIPLYYLVFASKHPIGRRFWHETQRIRSDSQRLLL